MTWQPSPSRPPPTRPPPRFYPHRDPSTHSQADPHPPSLSHLMAVVRHHHHRHLLALHHLLHLHPPSRPFRLSPRRFLSRLTARIPSSLATLSGTNCKRALTQSQRAHRIYLVPTRCPLPTDRYLALCMLLPPGRVLLCLSENVRHSPSQSSPISPRRYSQALSAWRFAPRRLAVWSASIARLHSARQLARIARQ